MSLPSAESDLLRQMVRQVLQEIVPQAMAAAPQSAASATESVVISTDADLQAFARRLATASDAERAAIASGATAFRLAGGAALAEMRPEPSNVVRIEKGAVTERHVREAASSGSSIHLGRKAVLTPLARDRARAAGVEITRER
jgi:predicted Zn-dependent protease with MMP-like domain